MTLIDLGKGIFLTQTNNQGWGKNMTSNNRDCYEIERVAGQFETLNRISTIVQNRMESSEIFHQILEEVNKAVDYSSACIFMLNKQEQRLEEIAKTGSKGDLINFVEFDLGKGFSSWVAKYRKPILMPNIKRYRESLDNHIRSFISMPILVDDDLMGVINVSNERSGSYDETDLIIVKIISSQVASLIERKYYREEIKRKDEDLASLKGFIESTDHGDKNSVTDLGFGVEQSSGCSSFSDKKNSRNSHRNKSRLMKLKSV
ncbi:MAG: GAF domain-containing protein [candidate division Zixibacteria bacterium]|nr:GAF domain-containing protein [candidate division Zixibacteria bacterium]